MLKPCPFCGSKKLEIEKEDSLDHWDLYIAGYIFIKCLDCEIECKGNLYDSEEELIKKWNQR